MQNKTGNSIFYVYDEHSAIDSCSFITNSDSRTIKNIQYLPFSESNRPLAVSSRIPLNYKKQYEQQRSTANYYTPYKFSGKEKDEETSYSYFGARYYMSDVSVWLSVDPMWDDYPYQSPYTYCAWNPINVIDPDGRSEGNPDNYTMDEKGNIKFQEKTDDDHDVLFTQESWDNGKKDESINVEKGVLGNPVVSCETVENKDTKVSAEEDVNLYFFKNSKERKSFYNFVVSNSKVEWQSIKAIDGNCKTQNVVGTNHQRNRVMIGTILKTTFGNDLIQSNHNHPAGSLSLSPADKRSVTLNPNTKFRLSIVCRNGKSSYVRHYLYGKNGFLKKDGDYVYEE